jgi:hypothetical protein
MKNIRGRSLAGPWVTFSEKTTEKTHLGLGYVSGRPLMFLEVSDV